MVPATWIVFAVAAIGFLLAVRCEVVGEAHPIYRNCVERCEKTGYVGEKLFQHCLFFSYDQPDRSWYMQEPLYLHWREWNCKSDCRYNCMIETEKERAVLGLGPLKYHDRWPFKRVSVLEEPVSAMFTGLNLVLHFNSWLSFFILVHYKMPLRPRSRKPYYEYTSLLHVYAALAVNAMFWGALCRVQDFDVLKKIDYSATAAFIAYSLVISIIRIFSIKDVACRVTVAAPLLSFITTHILYMNLYQLDLGLNKKITIVMGVAQLLLWAGFAVFTGHPSKFNIWLYVVGGSMIVYLEFLDFPPYKGYADSNGIARIIAVVTTFLWWSFFKDDAVFRSAALIKKFK